MTAVARLAEAVAARFTRGAEFLVPALRPDGQRRIVSIDRHRPECPVVLMIELTPEEERAVLASYNRWQGVRG